MNIRRSAPPSKKVKTPEAPSQPAPRGLVRTYQTLIEPAPPGHQQHLSAPGAPLPPLPPQQDLSPLPPIETSASSVGRFIPDVQNPLFDVRSGSDADSEGVREHGIVSSDSEFEFKFPTTISQYSNLTRKVCDSLCLASTYGTDTHHATHSVRSVSTWWTLRTRKTRT